MKKKSSRNASIFAKKFCSIIAILKKFYSKLRNMSGKLKKKNFMKPNNLFKFFVNFFYSIKNIYFPDILPHFKQKKNFLYISKKKSSRNVSIFAKKFCSIIAILKNNFILNCVIMSGKLKILQHFKQKKNFLYISKKKSSSMLRYSRKNFVQ